MEERREGYSTLIGAVKDIAVLQSEFSRFEVASLANHQTTRELIRSSMNDLRSIMQGHQDFNVKAHEVIAGNLEKHEEKDEIMRADIEEIKQKYKTGKMMLIAAVFGAVLVSRGLDGVVKLVNNFIGG